jgi:flagellar biosynthesis GTPase FlhF
MARRLEDSLYRTAKNRDEYGDFTSLKTRLQHLAVTMGARAQHKGGNPRAPSMMPNAAPGMVPGPQGMTMNPIAPGGVMNPQAQMISNMQYANMAGRMTPQQLQMQQLQMQMQNPQMRQQLTPQQIQQLQQAQMQQRRQAYQQMQQQHAQLQRQSSMQQQQFQQNQAQAQAQAQLQRQHSMRQQQQQQMQQRAQQQQRQQQQQLQRRTSMSGGSANRMSGDMSVGAQGGLGDPNDFLNLDLSGSLLGDDLGLDMLGASDPFKAPDQVTGHKRGMSQNQQQLKRAKVSGGGTPQSSQNNGSQMSAVNAK